MTDNNQNKIRYLRGNPKGLALEGAGSRGGIMGKGSAVGRHRESLAAKLESIRQGREACIMKHGLGEHRTRHLACAFGKYCSLPCTCPWGYGWGDKMDI